MVPILLLTGFLGSGKTTLLNRLLDQRPEEGPLSESGGKLALIVNEFGDVGIDGDLLPDEMTRQIEIKGGCICCMLDEDLEKTLIELLDSQSELSVIVIETTGIAEPLPISWTLARGRLADRVRLAAVITVVDVLEHEKHRPMSESVDAQVEYADLLVLTKLDLAENQHRTQVEASLRTRNQVAPILSGDSANLVDQLWRALDDPDFETVPRPVDTGAQRGDSHHFDSVVLAIESTLDFEVLSEELEELSADYVRIKGIARVVDASTGSSEPRMVAFHRVGARVSSEPLLPAHKQKQAKEPKTRMVAIGTHLDIQELAACLKAAVLP